MPVTVEGELDGGVPEPLLDLLRVGALGDEEGRASVAEVVKTKGGGEPGVLDMTWLLGRKDGAWFAVSASWNDETQTVDTTELATLLQGLIGQLATSG